ncbi:MAG TPA: hypothetical protein VK629_03335 [Steroidobacteraceae bacterium]|nr:hypothetical protein [Steroidobacteraceae bacterium]
MVAETVVRRVVSYLSCGALIAALALETATAQSRFVFVNGIRMNDTQIMQLQYFACTNIPNGAYWLQLGNGAWGYVGDSRVQGYFGDQCGRPGNNSASQRRNSLSERGLLYSPHEIIGGRP